jgi:hypothetical protein
MMTVGNTQIPYKIHLVLITLILCPFTYGKIIHVDDDATRANDGISWASAYLCVQDALAAARSGDEIRVAKGIYKPDQHFVRGRSPRVLASGDRTATFQLINGVTIKGGYAGFGEPDSDARDVNLYETILSGDLNGDDVDVSDPYDLVTEPTRTENSYHVVAGSGTDETAVLDGLFITAGNANGNQPHDKGGGMFNDPGSPTVTNCTFTENSARIIGGGMLNDVGSSTVVTNCTFTGNLALFDGGGMFNFSNGIPTVENCTFSGNSAKLGGGMYNDVESNTTVTNCTFSNNWAESQGGGMYNDVKSNITVTNCTFSDNWAESQGGGMYNLSNHPTLTNCIFSENSAEGSGGGMNNRFGSPNVTNCKFIGNSANNNGGGMRNQYDSHPNLSNCTFNNNSAKWGGGAITNVIECSPTVINCTFSCNYADRGGGVENREASNPTLINCTFSGNLTLWMSGDGVSNFLGSNPILTNCIVWGDTAQNTSQIDNDDTSSATITYSDVQGGWPGQGNINANPHFASLGYWVAPSPRTGDVLWVVGDCHLKSEAGRWDPNSESWIQDDVTSPCIDAGDPNSPITFEPFPNGGIINMGAYGGTVEASKSIYGLHTKYSGGTGRQNDPFQIATAEDLMLLSDSPEDYKKHFILTADINLDPNLPGRKIFDRAVIAPDMNDVEEGIQGTFFTGTFDGNDHTISHLTIKGDSFLGLFGSLYGDGISGAIISNLCLEAVDVNGAGDYVGGLVGYFSGSIITTYSAGTVIGEECVGGLVGYNTAIIDDGRMYYSTIESCYSSVDVSGVDCVGGLVGTNLYGAITNCYATGSVVASPTNWWLPGGVGSGLSGGGLVGENWHTISYCYATGSVVASGTTWIPGIGGGLVGENNGEVINCFWDTQTSGQTVSGGGTPKTTAEMQTESTFLEAGWDFVDETENGTDDIWWILEGQVYPRLWWEASN